MRIAAFAFLLASRSCFGARDNPADTVAEVDMPAAEAVVVAVHKVEARLRKHAIVLQRDLLRKFTRIVRKVSSLLST